MASNHEVAVTTAPDDGVDLPVAVNDRLSTPTISEISEDHKSLDEETQYLIPPLSLDQVDGNGDTKIKAYEKDPSTVQFAKIQGIAKLKEVLNDPNGEITDTIKKTTGFPTEKSANERCKKVRDYLTGEAQIEKRTVPFILAIWCMVGGIIPSLWNERPDGKRTGSKRSHTEWGKKMREELGHLGLGDGFEFDLCKGYATSNQSKPAFDVTEIEEVTKQWDEDAAKAKKPKPTATPTCLGKHGASSPRQPLASKRPNTVATETPQQIGASYAGDDDTKGQEGRAEVDKDMMVGLGNDAVPRRYGPGLKASNMSSDKILMGQKSQGRKEVYPVSKPMAPGFMADVPSSPVPSLAASSNLTPLEVSASVNRGPAVPRGQSHPAPEHPSGSGDANMVKGGGRGESLSFPSLRQDPMTGRHQNARRIASPVLRGSNGRGGKSGPENERLSSLSGSVTADREDPARLDEAVSNSKKSDAISPGSQPGDVSQEGQDTMTTAQPSQSSPILEQIKKLNEIALNDLMQRNGQNDWHKSRISRLEKKLRVKKAKILDLEKDVNILRAAGEKREQYKSTNTKLERELKESRQKVANMKDVLKRTSFNDIVQKAGTKGKPFSSMSLAELIDGIDVHDDMGILGQEDSQDQHGQSN